MSHTRVLFLLAACLVLFVLDCAAAEAEVAPDSTPIVVPLEYRETTNGVARWGYNVDAESKPFLKEPDTAAGKVTRGIIKLNSPAGLELAFLWDYRQGRLCLDLNRNRDLTDDPEGVFSTKARQFYYSQMFTNVHLAVKTATGTFPLCVDLHLYGPEQPKIYVSLICRSVWEGKVALAGRDWQVGRIDDDAGGVGERSRGCLLLRPWEERDRPFEVQNGLLDTFRFAQNVFFAGQAYELECNPAQQDGKGTYELRVRKANAMLGEINVTGKFVHRMLLTSVDKTPSETRFTVVLDRPKGVIKVPEGDYSNVQVQLQSGKLNASRDVYGNSGPSIHVAFGNPTPPVVAAGGPLTNSVSLHRRGRDLSMQYQLVGADGARYSMLDADRSHPPQFAVSRKGKQVHTGAFEYG